MAKQRVRAWITAAIALWMGIGLLTGSAVVSDGIRRGLEVCAGALIPALFPFMVLSCFLTRTDAARILSIPLTPITTRLFRLPGELGATVLLSLIGGYPVGAKMTANLLAQGKIEHSTAERMLCFCVNASPSFMISAVGVGMLGSYKAGAVLFGAQTMATILVGAIVSVRVPRPARKKVSPQTNPVMPAFVSAVTDASSAMLGMCSYAILFAGLLSLLTASGAPAAVADLFHVEPLIVEALAAGLFEVTTGCIAAAKPGGMAAILLINFCCSFGGLSVIFQIISCFEGASMRFWPFLLTRGLHFLLSAGISAALFQRAFGDINVMAVSDPPILQSDGRTWVVALCLLAMCSIVLVLIGKEQKTN